MFFLHLLFALVIALILTAIFGVGTRGWGAGSALLLFFLILFLASWAGGLWIAPYGPPLWGVPWVGFLFMGLLFALLLAAFFPAAEPPPRAVPETEEVTPSEAAAIITIDIFLWILLIILVVSIIAGYLI